MLGLEYLVKNTFKEAVNLHPTAPSELKRSLLSEPQNPNVKEYLDRITYQLKQADMANCSRGKYISKKTYQDTVYDMTNLFIDCFEGHVNKRKESDLDRIAREAVINREKEYEDVLAGKETTGDFQEAGVISDEKEDAKRERALEVKDRKEAHTKARI